MASEAQIAANRRNAQKSTGPTSVAGKAKAARNALRHGLTAGQLILAGENQADFQNFYSELVGAHAPIDAVEHGIVERIAMAHWRLRRAWRAEAAAFEGLRRRERRWRVEEVMVDTLRDRAVAKGADADDARDEAEKTLRHLPVAALDAAELPDGEAPPPWPTDEIESLQRYETALERTLHRLTLELDRARKNREERLYHAECFERVQEESEAAEPAAADPLPDSAAKRSQFPAEAAPDLAPNPRRPGRARWGMP